jgi:6-phosphogluconolactonase
MIGNRPSIFIFDNSNEMSDFMVKQWKALSSEAIRRKKFFVAALSGGRTPRDFYRKLSLDKGISTWDKNYLFLVDERLVPFTDDDSNYGMLDNLLLSRINIPLENRHFIPVKGLSPGTLAEKYEEDIKKFFRPQKSKFPEFDLIVLGVGKDGHTASLFPGAESLNENRHLAVAVKPEQTKYNRVTITLPVINSARNVIFLARGREKAMIIKKVIEEKDVSLPATLVKPAKGKLVFLLDREAGSLLEEKFQNKQETEDIMKFKEHKMDRIKEYRSGLDIYELVCWHE